MAEQQFKLFDMYDVSSVVVTDKSLKPYLNVSQKLLLKAFGRNRERFGITKVNIVERLANRISVPGHLGRKHKIITSWSSGKYNKNVGTVLETFKMIEERTKQNPVQVFVKAIENASPKDEITVIEQGGARYPQAVDVSPVRKINLVIRWIVQGSYQKSFGKKKKMFETLANEIILASQGNLESYAMSKKNESEKQADSAR